MKRSLALSLVLLLVVRVIYFFLFAPVLVAGKHIQIITTLLDDPQIKNHEMTLTVFYGTVFGKVPIRVTTEPSNQLEGGKMVEISGSLATKALHGGRQIWVLKDPVFTAQPSGIGKLIHSVIDMRKHVFMLYENFLPPQSAGLLLGIVLGVGGNFSQSFLTNLQNTGVMHIVAASGMNVTLLAGFLLPVMTKFFRRQYGLLIVVGVMAFYVVMSGMQPSIIRAALMMTCALGAQFLGRQYSIETALAWTIGLMIFVEPLLLTSVSFQLSVGATLGIMYLKPLFGNAWFLDDVTTSFAAQIATLPILLGSFGSIGILSLLVNLLILWTVPPLMILGGAAAILGSLVPFLGGILLLLAAPLLWYMTTVITYFGSFAFLLTVPEIPAFCWVGYYLLLLSIVWYQRVSAKKTS